MLTQLGAQLSVVVPQVQLAGVSIKRARGDVLLPVELLTSLLSFMPRPEPTVRATSAAARPSAGDWSAEWGWSGMKCWWSAGRMRWSAGRMQWIGGGMQWSAARMQWIAGGVEGLWVGELVECEWSGLVCRVQWYGVGVQWCVRVLLMCQRPQQGLCSSPQWSRTMFDSLVT